MKKLLISALILALLLIVSGANSEEFNSSVYSPNGTKYRFSLKAIDICVDESGETVNRTIIVNGYLELISRFLQVGYQAWGFNLNYSYIELEDGLQKSISSDNASIPPVLAVKEGTRKIYPTTVLMKFVRGEYKSPEEAAKDLSTNKPIENFYVYNPFYINIDAMIGDKVPYGYWNTTSNSGLIVYGVVEKETKIELNDEELSVLVVNLTSAVQEALSTFVEDYSVELDTINLLLFYEKSTGWLVKAYISGSGTAVEKDGGTEHNVTA